MPTVAGLLLLSKLSLFPESGSSVVPKSAFLSINMGFGIVHFMLTSTFAEGQHWATLESELEHGRVRPRVRVAEVKECFYFGSSEDCLCDRNATQSSQREYGGRGSSGHWLE